MPPVMDGSDPRVGILERAVQELVYRLDRSDSGAQYVNLKHHALTDSVTRLLHFQQELTRMVMSLVPNQESQHHKDGKFLGRSPSQWTGADATKAYQLSCEISRQLEIIRGLEEPHEPAYFDRRPYFGGVENAPVSPRHYTQDYGRRSSLAVPQPRAPYDHRPQIPSGLSQNLAISTKRVYGSIGGNSAANQVSSSTAHSSPSTLRPGPPPPPGPHPLSAIEHPSMARRHTSADIRVNESWRPQQPPPFSSGPPSSHLPSSPSHLGPPPDERLRESLSGYAFPPTQSPRHSRPPSPQPPQAPMFANGDTFKQLTNFQWDRSERRSVFQQDGSAPATRRGSMAHILNNDDDGDVRGEEDRKRKRLI